MSLESIKESLEERHFFARIVTGTLIVGTQPISDSDYPDISTFHAFCSIEANNTGFVIEYGHSNLPVEAHCLTAEEVVKFVVARFGDGEKTTLNTQ
jgi:hypothetical protein